MVTSEARKIANQANSQKSTGPKTPEGKARSRCNAFKHGLTGVGVALPNEDSAEIDRRHDAFEAELHPSGEVGRALARRAAFLSVRLDRCASQETASLSERVRIAEAEFVAPEGSNAIEADRLRAEAGARAMFDPSPAAILARKYEADTERGFLRALKELRQIDKEGRANDPAPMDESFRQAMGSFFRLDKEAAEWEKAYPDTTLPTPTKPARPVAQPSNPQVGDSFEVPFAIGRPR